MATTKIDGCPGGGKTTRLVKIITESGLPANKIAYCTFGRHALNEMKERMLAKGESESNLKYFRTLHSMNFHLLGLKTENVANRHLDEFCKEMNFHLSDKIIKGEKKKNTTDDTASEYEMDRLDDRFYIQMNKDRIEIRPFDYIHPRLKNYASLFLKFKYAYFSWMKNHEYVDFIGMIEQGIEQGVVPPVDLLCVDEWQDLNPLQIKQVRGWIENIPNSYHAGDSDQSIFEFSGADPTAFLNLHCDNKIILNQSFRLPSDILALSQEVITRNKIRENKNIHTEKPAGGIYIKSMYGVAQMLRSLPDNETCYVLVRNNCVVRGVMSDLMEEGIPVGGLQKECNAVTLMQSGYSKKHFSIIDIQTILHGSLFPARRYFERGSKKKIEKLLTQYFPDGGYTSDELLKCGMKKQFIEDLMRKDASHLNIDPKHLTYITKLFKNFGNKFNPVKIMTIHAAKGLEADTVILVPSVTRAVWDNEQNVQRIESERRVWYTAITRAIKRVILLDNSHYTGYNSRFEIPIRVCFNNIKNSKPI